MSKIVTLDNLKTAHNLVKPQLDKKLIIPAEEGNLGDILIKTEDSHKWVTVNKAETIVPEENGEYIKCYSSKDNIFVYIPYTEYSVSSDLEPIGIAIKTSDHSATVSLYMCSDNTPDSGYTNLQNLQRIIFGRLNQGLRLTTNSKTEFVGKEATQQLLEDCVDEKWKFSEDLTNLNNTDYYYAACSCWRFHTNGTNQGDWYLPGQCEFLWVHNTNYANIRQSVFGGRNFTVSLWTSYKASASQAYAYTPSSNSFTLSQVNNTSMIALPFSDF